MAKNGSVQTKKRGWPGYLEQSRSLVNSIVMLIPLLAVYETALFLANFKVMNRFDLLTPILPEYGFKGLLVFNALLFVAAVIAVVYLTKRRKLDPAVLPGMLMEALAYALVLSTCAIMLLPRVLTADPPSPSLVSLGLALGAGVYEELFFRLILLGMLYAWLTHTVRLQKSTALLSAFAVSSALFSLSHFHLPSLANFDFPLFAFRFIAGVVLGGIFLVRGLGVAAYTHAIYNVIVLLNLHEP